MASQNETGQFAPPSGGVRKDINRFITPADAATDATNALIFDGTVRPRPATTRERFETEALGQWQKIYERVQPGYQATSFVAIDGRLLRFDHNPGIGSIWRQSDDYGISWQSSLVSAPGLDLANNFCVGMLVTNTHLIAIMKDNTLWRGSLANYPTNPQIDLAFVSDINGSTNPDTGLLVGPGDNGILTLDYDATNDGMIWSTGSFGRTTHYTADVSTGTNFTYYKVFNDPPPAYFGADESPLNPDGRTYVVWAQPYLLGGYWSGVVGWTGSSFLWADGASMAIWFPPEYVPQRGDYLQAAGVKKLEVVPGVPYTFPDGPYTSIKNKYQWLDSGVADFVRLDDDRLLLLTRYDGFIYRIDDDPTTDDTVVWDEDLDIYGLGTDVYYNMIEKHQGSGRIYIFGGKQSKISDDNGLSYQGTAILTVNDEILHPNAWKTMQVHEAGTQFYYVLRDADYGPGYFRYQYIGLIRRTPASSALPIESGDVTSIFQADMDTEEKAILVGTTRHILHLNRSANVWERATGGAITTAPESPSTQMTGVHGRNPVVFRLFDSNFRTYILSTNGSDYPIVWHPDLPNGRARFMGSIVAGSSDPQYDLGDPPEGNPAPKARCMAAAANRLLLGNLPGISPYAIDVSKTLDFDRGWNGRVQQQMLGDTPGAIIAMNEISALQVAIYKEDAVYHGIAQAEFLGTALPFRFELSKGGISGPCSPLAIVSVQEGSQAYLARDGGVYIYDGTVPNDLGRSIRRMVQPYLDENEYGKSWGMMDSHRKLLWFFYPSKSGALNRGLIMATDQGYPWPIWPVKFPDGWQMAAGMRAFFLSDKAVGELQDRMNAYGAATLGSFLDGREEMIMGRLDNTWYTQKWDDDGDYSDDGQAIEFFLETGWDGLGIRFKTVHELYHALRSDGPGFRLDVTLLAQQMTQSIKESGPKVLNADSARRKTSHRITGVAHAMRLEGNIRRLFSWAGAASKQVWRGER